MAKVTYRLSDGTSRTIEAEPGKSVMQIAVDNDVAGIIGRCGGFCNCGTCHVYVGDQWLALLPEQSEEEDAMLDGTPAERLHSSRLGCQVKLSEALDGMVVTVPDCQE